MTCSGPGTARSELTSRGIEGDATEFPAADSVARRRDLELLLGSEELAGLIPSGLDETTSVAPRK
jgi:hypothetical protein